MPNAHEIASPHGPPPHHILISGDTGPTMVNDVVSQQVVLNVPLVKPLNLVDGRSVESIGLDGEALIALASVLHDYGQNCAQMLVEMNAGNCDLSTMSRSDFGAALEANRIAGVSFHPAVGGEASQ